MIKAIRNWGAPAVLGGKALSAKELARMDYIESEYTAHAAKVRKALSGQ